MYQMRDELIRLKCGDPLYNDLDANGHVRTRCRGELSLSDAPWFQEAPAWNMYWLNLWVLHFGVDMFMQRASLGEDPRYTEAFQFFSRYAGQERSRHGTRRMVLVARRPRCRRPRPISR